MLQIASLESLLGSIWFAGLSFFVGYIAGQVFPISRLASMFTRR